MANAIEFNHVSKLYRLGLVSTGALRDDIQRFWVTKILKKEDPYLKIGATNDRTKKGDSNYVWALKDIDFKVEQGDVVGIIGKNGAGKSTLLKLLSRVTGPTTGIIKAHGRIGSLLEVGTGFHPEMTGRENIFMNGAILGMTHKEIQSKLDAIVDFSGCERYIDTPVKRYSSGMTVRLGFAVAAHLDPEILVVDEVLAVGDAEFQKKAIGKMQDVSKGEGRTVLFVSHNMASVKKLCKSGILLEQGSVKYTGRINDVVEQYIGGDVNNENCYFNNLKDAPGNENLRIVSFEVMPKSGKQLNVESGIVVHMKFMNYKPDITMDVTTELMTTDEIVIFHKTHFIADNKNSKIGMYDYEFELPPFLINAGTFKFQVWFGENQKYLLWGKYEHKFTIENTLNGQGFSMNVMPGIIKPNIDYVIKFEG